MSISTAGTLSGTQLLSGPSSRQQFRFQKINLQQRSRKSGRQRKEPLRVSSELLDPVTSSAAAPDLTWQVTVGAIAGVTPFVVAGIEFSKRIMEQRRCKVCGGSGLVKRVGVLVRYGSSAVNSTLEILLK
ncbi:hypothetical protein R1sor_026127 [Riccia sorocarpa]|uniref:Uncharacterized protein n=1 Tax=Riccia sorocarpa TaxID=122646 RepID=A0ABD3GEJ4_9MARC